MTQTNFRFTPRKPRAERDRTPDEDSLRRMSEGGRKGGKAGLGKPKNRELGDSKYDPLLNAFINSPHNLVKVEIETTLTGYTLTRTLNNRIWTRKLEGIKASTVNDNVYLEKL